jgi:hypothetical protein
MMLFMKLFCEVLLAQKLAWLLKSVAQIWIFVPLFFATVTTLAVFHAKAVLVLLPVAGFIE